MKKYRLKKRYLSLYEDIEEGIEVEYKDGWIYYVNTRGNKTCIEFDPDEFMFTYYWEEVKQTLFTTEDGVEVFDKNHALWEVFPDFQRVVTIAEYVEKGNKTFNHESNADEYIWRNKPLFSYEDMRIALGSQILTIEDLIMRAKERAGYEQ